MSGADLPRTIAHGRHILKAREGFADIPVSRFAFCSRRSRTGRKVSRANGSEWKIDGQIIIVARGNEWKR